MFSNSLLHHMNDPLAFWSEAYRLLRPGGALVVQDLFRPRSEKEALRLVRKHAKRSPPVLRDLFHRSLLAAYRPEEVEEQLRLSGAPAFQVHTISDRHILVSGRKRQ